MSSAATAVQSVASALHLAPDLDAIREQQRAVLVNTNPRIANTQGCMQAVWRKKAHTPADDTRQLDLLQVTNDEPQPQPQDKQQRAKQLRQPQKELIQLLLQDSADASASEHAGGGTVSAAGVVRLMVNGRPYTLHQPDPQLTLAQFLRVTLGLTGTKIGCNEGGCGACMVSIARRDPLSGSVVSSSVNSCLHLVAAMDGEAVLTVEGLGSVESGLHPLQQSMVVHAGTQCGYCTPGQIMNAYGLIASQPDGKLPTHEQLEQNFDSVLCRCTGYRPIVAAMRAVVSGGRTMQPEGVSMTEGAPACSSPVPKLQAHLKPCGKGSGAGCSSGAKGACASKGVGCGFDAKACSNDIEDLAFDPSNPKHKIDPFAVRQPCARAPNKHAADHQCGGAGCGSSSRSSSNGGNSAKQTASEQVVRQNSFWWSSNESQLFLAPSSLSQLLRIAAFFARDSSERVRFVCGGTSPGVTRYYRRHEETDEPTVLVQVSALAELLRIDAKASQGEQRGLRVGAAVSLAALEQQLSSLPEDECGPSFRPLAWHVRNVASSSLRAVASWAGNLQVAKAHPDFPSDLLTILSAAGASVSLLRQGAADPRVVPVSQWLHTALLPGEVLLDLFVPYLPSSTLFRTFKTRSRNMLAHPIVNAAFRLDADGTAFISYGGVKDGLLTAPRTSKLLGELAPRFDPAALHRVVESLSAEAEEVLEGPDSSEATIETQAQFAANAEWASMIKDKDRCLGAADGVPGDLRGAAERSAHKLVQSLHERPVKRLLAPKATRHLLLRNLAFKFLVELLSLREDGPPQAKGASASSRDAEERKDNEDAAELEARRNKRALTYQRLERPLSSGVQQFSGTYDEAMAPLHLPLAKLEADVQCTGEAKFTADLPMPQGAQSVNGGLFGAYVWSTVAAGTLLRVDCEAAMRVPGVARVVTARDVSRIGGSNECGMFPGDEEIFASREVLCVGQRIGLVLADSELAAETAARLVRVEYGPPRLPAMLSLDDAIAAKRFMPNTDAAQFCDPIQSGDVDAALKSAKHRISGTNRAKGAYHFCMETQSSYAVPSADGTSDGMEVFCASQGTQKVREMVSRAIGRPAHGIVVRTKHTGGGFGSKLARNIPNACAVAVACALMNRPIKVQHSRYADQEIVGKRPEFRCDFEVGFDDSGVVSALRLQFYFKGGIAYDLNTGTQMMALRWADNAYHIPNFYCAGSVARTNTLANTSMRGPGNTRSIWNIELIMERVAAALRIDPAVVRERNFYAHGAQMTPFKNPLFHCTMQDVWRTLKEKAQYDRLRSECAAFNARHRYRKRAVSMSAVKYPMTYEGPDNHHGVCLSVYKEDGSIHIAHSGAEMGQGINTKVAATVVYGINKFLADGGASFRVTMSDVRVAEANSAYIANAGETGGSSGSETCCLTATYATDELAKRLAPVLKKQKGELASWAQLIDAAADQQVHLQVLTEHNKPEGFFQYMVWAAAVSVVELDVLTCAHQLLSVDILYDVGRPLLPIVDIGQIEGGFMIGVGGCTSEEVAEDEDTGELLSKGSWDYHIPTAGDIPQRFNVALLPNAPNPRGVLSSKATAEPPVMLSASVHQALRECVASVRRDNGRDEWFDWPSPATPLKMLALCGAAKTDGSAGSI